MKHLIVIIFSWLPVTVCFGQADFSVGQNVEVYDPIEKNWFASTILKTGSGQFFIHYKGYDAKWDVWVGPDRIRRPGESKASPVYSLVSTDEVVYRYMARDEVRIAYWTPDSSSFLSGADTYSFKKLPGQDFQSSIKKLEGRVTLYFVPVDDNSFIIYHFDGYFTYYHRNKEAGLELQRKGYGPKADSIIAHINKLEAGSRAAAAKGAQDKQFKSFSAYISTLKSKRTDPNLEAEITKWWNGDGQVVNPLLKIYLEEDFSVKRNNLGVILNKYIIVMLAYKQGSDGKCFIRWETLGYENQGGGTYGTRLRAGLEPNSYYRIDGINLNAGKGYEVDCASIKK